MINLIQSSKDRVGSKMTLRIFTVLEGKTIQLEPGARERTDPISIKFNFITTRFWVI